MTPWTSAYQAPLSNLDSIFKSRGITLPAKVRLVEAMAFLVVVYGCELDSKEMSFQILCPFLTGLSVLLLLSCKRFLYFGYKSLIRYMTDKYFPPVCGLPFYFLVVFFEKLSIKELMLLNCGVKKDF